MTADVDMIDTSPDVNSDISAEVLLDISLHVRQGTKLCQACPREDLDLSDLDNRIHPIFGFVNFADITPEGYDKLLPSLRLASLLLIEPCLLTFWHDIFFSPVNEDYEYRKTVRQLTISETQRTHLALLLMSGNAKFRPMSEKESQQLCAIGATEPSEDPAETWHLAWQGWFGSASETTYLAAHFAEAATDTAAARLQKRFRLAVVLLHELAHAAHFLVRSGSAEPYYGAAAVAEAGFDWEAFAFGGIVRERRDERARTVATLLAPWPNACCGLDMAARSRAVPRTVLAWCIPPAFVQKLFRAAFWAREVKEAGRAALRPDCCVGCLWDADADRPVDFGTCLDLRPRNAGSFLPADCYLDAAGVVRKRVVMAG